MQLKIGSPPTSHELYKSNLVAFVLAPRITGIDPESVSRGAQLTLDFEPAIAPEQKVTALIGDLILSVPQRDPKTDPVKKLSISIPADFPAGTFLLRLRVDGAESFLKDAEPKITVS